MDNEVVEHKPSALCSRFIFSPSLSHCRGHFQSRDRLSAHLLKFNAPALWGLAFLQPAPLYPYLSLSNGQLRMLPFVEKARGIMHASPAPLTMVCIDQRRTHRGSWLRVFSKVERCSSYYCILLDVKSFFCATLPSASPNIRIEERRDQLWRLPSSWA